MTTALLDGNVLVAFSLPEHMHHDAAHNWWSTTTPGGFATCPITQGTLLRAALRAGATAAGARSVLHGVTQIDGHEFWPDDLPYTDIRLTGVIGHRQVTDAYLAALARARGGRLVTLDRGLAALHPDVTELVDTA